MERFSPRELYHKHKESLINQGEKTSDVFAGKYKFLPTKELYGESAYFISHIIQKLLPPFGNTENRYEFADLGSFKGELLGNILAELPAHHFHTTAVDINESALKENHADQKIIAALDRLPIKNGSQDVVLARYVLVWNEPEQQKKILKEIARITKGVAVVQHAGADSENSDQWRARLNDLLDGQEIPKLKREGHFFSSREEVEKWLEEDNIHFERLAERKIDNFSDVFIERFDLNENDRKIMKNILNEKDYIFQTTWLIFPNEIGNK